MPGKAAKIVFTEKQQAILFEFASSRSVSVALAQRSKIILLAFDGLTNEQIEAEVGLGHDQVGKWRRRWQSEQDRLNSIECAWEPIELRRAIEQVLADVQRSGRPPTITSEQQSQLVAKACEDPQASGRPIARWTAAELAQEMVCTDTIPSISSRWVSALLARMKIRPHRIDYWMFSKDKIKDPNFDERVRLVCSTYHEAIELYKRHGVHTISMDEMTGVQALERIAPDKHVIAGSSAKREYEYRRHGTIGLFGNFHVATGKVWCPLLRETRTEEDTLENLDNVIGEDPKARFRFVMDNLTTHASESIVRYVAESIGHTGDLGKKGVRGILKSVRSRVEFLTNPAHRLQFIYTPRHCSWLNQIEMWFSTLQRKVTGAMSFTSITHLTERIESFIKYYNTNYAKPYSWTYTGRVLVE
jgi:transposase